jgi:hypothetical protein
MQKKESINSLKRYIAAYHVREVTTQHNLKGPGKGGIIFVTKPPVLVALNSGDQRYSSW